MAPMRFCVVLVAIWSVSFVGASNSDVGPVPGESSIYNSYYGTAPPFPANMTGPIFPTSSEPAGPDDLLFQNLLAAEWIVYSFYQRGVEFFTASNFTDLGFPNTTYQRITEIRDNEAGHMRIFQDQISPASLKPGSCAYNFSFEDVETFLVVQTVIEVTSEAFLSGLVLQANLDISKSAVLAIASTETRHLLWSLIDVWNVDPFGGPSETIYPYANQILDLTNRFVIPGSCPAANPVFPNPTQNLPQLSFNSTTPPIPGSPINFIYTNSWNVPKFRDDRKYYAVFFHGLLKISVPFDPKTSSSVIPKVFEEKGIIIVNIADRKGAPTKESVLAGPALILLQPLINIGSS